MIYRLFIISLISLTFRSPADSLRLEGEPYQPNVPIVWAATNKIPQSLMVYKVIPQQFTKEIISNVLAMASFKPVTMKLSPDKKTMHWDWHDEQGTLVRSLDIAPAYGWINYNNYKAIQNSTNAARGVPTFEETKKLALEYLQWLGGDTNQLDLNKTSRTDQERTLYDKRPWKGGHVILQDVTMRGIMLARQLGGIRIASPCGRGGISIDFGNDAKVSELELVWRNLQPYKQYKTATPDEIIAMIKAGKAVVPLMQDANLDEVPKIKKLTINQITIYYWGEVGGAPQKFTYPFAELQMTGDLGTNTLDFAVDCPIIDEAKP